MQLQTNSKPQGKGLESLRWNDFRYVVQYNLQVKVAVDQHFDDQLQKVVWGNEELLETE